jgi:hypothetical protein
MSSIRVNLNGQHKHTVSLEGHPGVLSCIVNYRISLPESDNEQRTEDGYHMLVGGIDNATGDYVDWPRIEIAVGDRIEFEILATSDAYPAASRRPYEGNDTESSQKDYIRSMAKKFGWEVIEHEAPSQTNQSEQDVAPNA